jgi:hypothetical protein
MEVPADVDTVTYANADLTETINVFEQYGVRLLTPDEISKEMPDYPLEPFPPEFLQLAIRLEWNQGCQCRSKNKSMKRFLILALQHQRVAALKRENERLQNLNQQRADDISF